TAASIMAPVRQHEEPEERVLDPFEVARLQIGMCRVGTIAWLIRLGVPVLAAVLFVRASAAHPPTSFFPPGNSPTDLARFFDDGTYYLGAALRGLIFGFLLSFPLAFLYRGCCTLLLRRRLRPLPGIDAAHVVLPLYGGDGDAARMAE